MEAAREIAETSEEIGNIETNELIDELLLVAEYIANDYIKDSIETYEKQKLTFQFFVFGSLFVLLLAAMALSRSINSPLRKLMVAIEDAKDPKKEIDIDTNRRDEIGKVSLAFLQMVAHARKQQEIEVELLRENFMKLFSNIHLGTMLNSIIRDENNNIFDYVVVEENEGYKTILKKLQVDSNNTYRNIFLDIIQKVNNQNMSFTVETYIEACDIHLDITAFPLQDDQVVILIEDITKKVQLESEKRESEDILRNQQRLEAIGTLAGGVAHEINNPINGVLNYGQLILDASREKSTTHAYAQEIVSESNRIAVIVRSLLQFSRRESHNLELVAVDDLLSQTLSLIKSIAMHDQIELIVNIDNCPPIKCKIQQIQQVVLNLLTNARSALNEKYPDYNKNKIIKLECSTVEIEGRKWFRLTVEDHGNGIPADILGKIYDPFFSTKSRNEGTGLGLAISYNIVEDHSGKLYCETERYEYAKFFLELPYDID